jgi:hypothetical protein
MLPTVMNWLKLAEIAPKKAEQPLYQAREIKIVEELPKQETPSQIKQMTEVLLQRIEIT